MLLLLLPLRDALPPLAAVSRSFLSSMLAKFPFELLLEFPVEFFVVAMTF